MATTTKETVETPIVETYDPWKDMREITLPRASSSEQNFQFVSVNDRRFQVPRSGRPEKVPYPVYEALMNSAALKDHAAQRKEDLLRQSKVN